MLEVKNLKIYFPIRSGIFKKRTGWMRAVDDVSFSVKKGETLGLVGESGCGKTTLGRTVIGLLKPFSGNIFFKGEDILNLKKKKSREVRKNMQMIFQDPFEALNPRHTIKEILSEPFIIHFIKDKKKIDDEIYSLLAKTGLSEDALDRFPHEFSGGQRQRICIARAIALKPEMLICDEPVSALDVSVQAQILNLMLELQNEMNLSSIFISHDISAVKHVSDSIAVMYLGKIVEKTDSDAIYKTPLHPYTKQLISSIPNFFSKNKIDNATKADNSFIPEKGCRFYPRCDYRSSICEEKEPVLKPAKNNENHLIACHI